MKLFCIKHGHTLVSNLYFSSKVDAKAKRDELNRTDQGHTITPGPDHHRFNKSGEKKGGSNRRIYA